MSYDDDYIYALELHKRLNGVDDDDDIYENFTKQSFQKSSNAMVLVGRSNPHSNLDSDFLNRTQNLVHPQWETLDPTPDIFSLFQQFDSKFFQNRLKCVTLEWSKRMYCCAGICYSRKNHYGMDVTIRLSEPLLKLRTRKDLVETLLHEMIHAYCFVLNIREGNGGHGPNFRKIMFAINKVAGTNITVYHTFHDEVDQYKQHWWRCNGICQDHSPFFGFVKRTSNRAPGPNDIWWSRHQDDCGGTFMKIKEPNKPINSKIKSSNNSKKIKELTGSNEHLDLRKYLIPQLKSTVGKSSKSNCSEFENLNTVLIENSITTDTNSTFLMNSKRKNAIPTESSSITKSFPPSSYPGLTSDPFNKRFTNSRNIVGFHNFANHGSNSKDQVSLKWDKGNTLSSTRRTNNPTMSNNSNGEVDRQHLRNLWSQRFEKPNCEDAKKYKNESIAKKRCLSNIAENSHVFISESKPKEWIVVDDDIMLQEEKSEVIDLSSDSDNDSNEDNISENNIRNGSSKINLRINKNMTAEERQAIIKKEILDESLDLCDNDIELIDDEYDDGVSVNADITAASELANTNIINEFFGEDTLLKEYNLENAVIATFSGYHLNFDNDIITCPICQTKMARKLFDEHLNGCTGITIKIQPPKHTLKELSAISKEARPKKQLKRRKRDVLRDAGYTEADLTEICLQSSMDESEDDTCLLTSCNVSINTTRDSNVEYNSSQEQDENMKHYRQRNLYKNTRQCPACGCEIDNGKIVDHLNECTKKK